MQGLIFGILRYIVSMGNQMVTSEIRLPFNIIF